MCMCIQIYNLNFKYGQIDLKLGLLFSIYAYVFQDK